MKDYASILGAFLCQKNNMDEYEYLEYLKQIEVLTADLGERDLLEPVCNEYGRVQGCYRTMPAEFDE